MKLGEIYDLVIKHGLEKDPRTKKELNERMRKIRREYKSLKGADKKCFDRESLRHPFSDTRILYGDPDGEVRTVMVGVDVGGEELLTAYMLNEKGLGVDLAMSHHPSGRPLAELYNVMHVQTEILGHIGIEKKVAELLMKDRIEEVTRRFLPVNHQRSVDTARLLNIPFMCVHTPADNHVTRFLQSMFDRKKPRKVKDVLALLKTIPEYRDGMQKGAGPRLIAGKEENTTGRILVDMTGGTEGSKRVFSRLSQAGIKTIVAMHLGEEHYKNARAEFMNVVIAGHIASDNIGLNLILDEVTKNRGVNIIPCSGFTRVKR